MLILRGTLKTEYFVIKKIGKVGEKMEKKKQKGKPPGPLALQETSFTEVSQIIWGTLREEEEEEEELPEAEVRFRLENQLFLLENNL